MDNRIENLKEVTRFENMHNWGISKSNTSGFLGVHFDKVKNKFVASIMAKHKYYFLGYFGTAEEASIAYNQAKKVHHPSVN